MHQTTTFVALCFLASPAVLCAQDAGITDPLKPKVPAAAAESSASAYSGFAKDLISSKALLAVVPGSIIDQVHPFPKEWGVGTHALEKRAASLYGQYVIGDFLERSVIAIDHESTKYRRRGHGNFFGRFAHVVVDTVVARKPDGHRMPAYSMLANDYGSWAIATLWCPPSLRTPGSIFEWGTGNVGVRAAGNLFREYWPDVKSVFHKKQQP